MKIGIFAEGSYPYVQGGVSSWSHMLINHFNEDEYLLHTIVPTEDYLGKFLYTLPKNVTSVVETVLLGEDRTPITRRHRLKDTEKIALRSLLFGEATDWAELFRLFDKPSISIDAILMGEDFLDMVTELYQRDYNRTVFSDFLWTIRSIHLPLFRILKSKVLSCDMYETISTGYAGVMAAKGAVLNNRPLLLTEHGIYTREREEEIIKADWTQGVYKDLWINFFYKLSACCYQYADVVVSLFENARKLQVEIGCPADKTMVVHNGVNYEHYQDIPPKDPEDEYINVGAVVRVTPIKDIKTMISAFGAAKQRMSNLKLWIMGSQEEDQEYYESCLDLVASLEIEDVIFTGQINVVEYMGRMDMILLTSISEGQPLSVLEAMAAGKPCITTNVGNCESLLMGEADDFGPCGIVTPVMNSTAIAQAIIRLARDENMRIQYGSVGRQRVLGRYTDREFFEHYKDLYDALELEPAEVRREKLAFLAQPEKAVEI
jgi:glycosyltransferase involved in cell wall biosynthesis